MSTQFPILPALSGILLHTAVVWVAAYTVAPGLIHMEQQADQNAASSATASGGNSNSSGDSNSSSCSNGGSGGSYDGSSGRSGLPALGSELHSYLSCKELQRHAPLLLSCQPLWVQGVLAAAMVALPVLAAFAAHLYYRVHYVQACALLLQQLPQQQQPQPQEQQQVQGEQQGGAPTPLAAAAAAMRQPEGSSLYRSVVRRRALAILVSCWAAGNECIFLLYELWKEKPGLTYSTSYASLPLTIRTSNPHAVCSTYRSPCRANLLFPSAHPVR